MIPVLAFTGSVADSAALHVVSARDGELDSSAQTRTPVHFVIGESDAYYGSARISRTYEQLCRFSILAQLIKP